MGSSSAGKSFMRACGSQASDLEVTTTREAVILTEALINVNFQNNIYLCLNKHPRALIQAGH